MEMVLSVPVPEETACAKALRWKGLGVFKIEN